MRILPLLLPLALIGAPACGDADDGSGFEDFSDATSTSFSDAGNWSTSTGAADTSVSQPYDTIAGQDAGTPDVIPPPDPEDELDFDLRTPEAGETFLYIPSAGLDALVVVDARTLDVSLVDVGVEPILVRALPGDQGAVVLNAGSRDVSVVRPNAAGTFDVSHIDVLPDLNSMVVSPDGAWAFLFYDHRQVGSGGFGSLQDVSAVRLVEGEEAVYNLAVGFKPESVRFADQDRLALILCERGISGVYLDDLVGDAFLPPVALDDRPFVTPVDREIAIVQSGARAIVRDFAAPGPELVLVDLLTQTRRVLPLADWPSDIDLTPDGGTVVVPMKTTQQVALVRVPEAFEWVAPDPTDPEEPAPANPFVTYTATGAPFGASALTHDGGRALLYTTDVGTAAIGMVDVTTGGVVLQPLVKDVRGVLVAPDGRMAALLHRYAGGTDEAVRNHHAYSLLDLDTGFTKLVLTDDAVAEVIFTDDASELFALIPSASAVGAHRVHRVSTASFAVIPYTTPDAPIFVGAMPQVAKVAIALDDPTGWITFVDTDDGSVDQVNSFELNSFIE